MILSLSHSRARSPAAPRGFLAPPFDKLRTGLGMTSKGVRLVRREDLPRM